ncbi:mitochondrial import inner membrane translocase subunit Tim10 B-like [Macrobrachium nipponense]|uniref:mitochondrial import inner membrane translocase subunit Tim10 B-like n=1 Tax=Macrobrachium nipponense TaxID=159736 RepID=UPI0030C7DB77
MDEVESQFRQFKDFLYLYNQISEKCFDLCITRLHQRDLTETETACVDTCVGKQVSVNHKIMAVYSEVQPIYMQKRLDEMNKQIEAQQQMAAQLEEQQNLQNLQTEPQT